MHGYHIIVNTQLFISRNVTHGNSDLEPRNDCLSAERCALAAGTPRFECHGP